MVGQEVDLQLGGRLKDVEADVAGEESLHHVPQQRLADPPGLVRADHVGLVQDGRQRIRVVVHHLDLVVWLHLPHSVRFLSTS